LAFRAQKRTTQNAVPKLHSTERENALSSDDLGREQRYVSTLYDRLDELRTRTSHRLATVLRQAGGTQQARTERESAVAMYTERLAQLGAVEDGLCFGRLDLTDGRQRYIGRIGLNADTPPENGRGDAVDEPPLMDWRAPAARPFYLATAAAPDGVRRRRHIRSRGRTVTALDDEVLDLDAARQTRHEGLAGEAALLAALTANRTGRMRDIVETIQAEQDEVIRAGMAGVLVVQGGPGTGKTAVALHRAAYLLYTHRRVLSTRAVLLVGPNETFLRYISQVLPSLAETGVLLRTLGQLYPGLVAERAEPAAVAEVKGRAGMAGVLAAAVRDRQEVPDEPVRIMVGGQPLVLDPATCAAARDWARRTGQPHNEARERFRLEIVHALASQVADRIGADPLGGDNLLSEADLAETRRELGEDPAVTAVLDRLWPVLTPRRLLADLFASAGRLATAAPELTAAQRELLARRPGPADGRGWTPADVPLLDEAAELLGDPPLRMAAGRSAAAAAERELIEYAEGALEIARGSRSIDVEDEVDPEILAVTDLLDAGRLAQRQDVGERLTAAQRAAADRRWAFGHVIVDEAQELSPMAWRLLMRRCPSRSMTIVGDVAQTGDLGGAASWSQVIEPYVDTRWRLAELSVSYRTPAEIMTLAGRVLAGIDRSLRPPLAVRTGGAPPWIRGVPAGRLPAELAAAASGELAEVGDGRVGVIVPVTSADELGRAVTAAVRQAAVGDRPDLRERVVVLTVRQAKGLEFDSVVVADPDRIVAESPRGLSDLYVALTRSTHRLGVLHPGDAPASLRA
jgi:DNA helicase IV